MERLAVVYALPLEQVIVELDFEAGMTAGMALRRSGLCERYPEILERELVLGVFGRPVAADQIVKPGDRVEISRPLIADPREMRREFVSAGRVMGGAATPENRPQDGSRVRSRSMRDTRPSSK